MALTWQLACLVGVVAVAKTTALKVIARGASTTTTRTTAAAATTTTYSTHTTEQQQQQKALRNENVEHV